MTIELNHLVVPVDFGESSQDALDMAIELTRRFGAQLTLVHACEIPAYVYDGMTYSTADMIAPIETAAREQLDTTLREVQGKIPSAQAVLRRGPAAQGILAAINDLHPDLVVMGTHGRTGMGHALLGSVAERVVRLSPAPVLTMRAKQLS